MNADKLNISLNNAQSHLLSELTPAGCWPGRLSSSSLATAIAAFTLAKAGRKDLSRRGFRWLAEQRNADGGWGDSPCSPSNFTTTLLCWCALSNATPEFADASKTARDWLAERVGSLDGPALADYVLEFYGNDRTFSVPILAMCRMAGKIDEWRLVPQLPFELAVLPHQLYKWLRLSVVSYALPALIAIGLARHRNRPTRSFLLRSIRNAAAAKAMRKLREIQPASGGYLEAQPLTGFVAMNLCAAGFEDHPTTAACISFLEDTIRDDGSWPIDTNLANWLTSLSVCAAHNIDAALEQTDRERIRQYLLSTQYRVEHPYTHGAPGGWSWTHSSGGVPDADDTAATLLALHRLDQENRAFSNVPDAGPPYYEDGIRWLLGIQNRDGGIPTFCKGWGNLPFDRSCPDLTAHMIQAASAWCSEIAPPLRRRTVRAIRRGLSYLERQQQDDGSWIPLWFGNQNTDNQVNPVYGTACVLSGLLSLDRSIYPRVGQLIERGVQWLEAAQGGDGGWGGAPGTPASIEETALAVSALAKAGSSPAAMNGAEWLIRETKEGTQFPAAPIGLYFATLWYSERLYPVIFTVQALKAVLP